MALNEWQGSNDDLFKMNLNRTQSANRSGADYFVQGIQLACAKETRRFILIPLTINVLLLLLVYFLAFHQLDSLDHWLKSLLPSYFKWLASIAWFFIILLLLVLSTFVFSTTANWIAAPVNGLLSEHIEAKLTGQKAPDSSWAALIKDTPRTLKRELQKLGYYIPRAIFLLIFLWIPVIGQTLGTLLWFCFSAWMIAIQYYDYPFDNHKVPFNQMLSLFKGHRRIAFEFGMIVMVCMMVPFLNLIIMPVAVCGATAMWVDRFHAPWTISNGHPHESAHDLTEVAKSTELKTKDRNPLTKNTR